MIINNMRKPNEQITNGNVLEFLKRYWFIVAMIISMAMLWANTTRDIAENREMNLAQNEDIKFNTASITTMNDKYIEDITYIKTKLRELAEDH